MWADLPAFFQNEYEYFLIDIAKIIYYIITMSYQLQSLLFDFKYRKGSNGSDPKDILRLLLSKQPATQRQVTKFSPEIFHQRLEWVDENVRQFLGLEKEQELPLKPKDNGAHSMVFDMMPDQVLKIGRGDIYRPSGYKGLVSPICSQYNQNLDISFGIFEKLSTDQLPSRLERIKQYLKCIQSGYCLIDPSPFNFGYSKKQSAWQILDSGAVGRWDELSVREHTCKYLAPHFLHYLNCFTANTKQALIPIYSFLPEPVKNVWRSIKPK